jgi:hypothetical protein
MNNQASQIESNDDGIVIDVDLSELTTDPLRPSVCDTSGGVTVVYPRETAEDLRKRDPEGVYSR